MTKEKSSASPLFKPSTFPRTISSGSTPSLGWISERVAMYSLSQLSNTNDQFVAVVASTSRQYQRQARERQCCPGTNESIDVDYMPNSSCSLRLTQFHPGPQNIYNKKSCCSGKVSLRYLSDRRIRSPFTVSFLIESWSISYNIFNQCRICKLHLSPREELSIPYSAQLARLELCRENGTEFVGHCAW